MRRREVYIAAGIVLVAMVSYSVVLPLLPQLMRRFGLGVGGVGALLACYAAAQLAASPVLGRLSDRFGRKPVLVASVLLAAESLLVTAWAGDVYMLFMSRIMAGVAAGNIPVAQAVRADLGGDDDMPAWGLSLTAGAFGLGLVVGPLLAVLGGMSIPCLAAAALAVLVLGAVVVLLPETLSAGSAAGARSPRQFVRAVFERAIEDPVAARLLRVRLAYGLAFAVFQSVFSVFTVRRFALTIPQNGYLLAYAGMAAVGTELFFVGTRFAERHKWGILAVAVLVSGVALLGWPFAPSVVTLTLLVGPLGAAWGAVTAVIAALLTVRADGEDVGAILGLGGVLDGPARVVAPLLGSALIGGVGLSAPGIASGVALVVLSGYVAFAAPRPRRRTQAHPA